MNDIDFEKHLNLIEIGNDDSHIHALEKLTDLSQAILDNPKTASAIFKFMELYPDADLGSPGPLVHFLEQSFPNYIDQLLDSLQKRPTNYTLWMANRILNANIDENIKQKLVLRLKEASKHPLANALEKQQANDFLQLHL